MLILLLIIPPAAIGQPYSPAKFDCPDTGARTDRYSRLVPIVRRRSIGAGARGRAPGAGSAFEPPPKCFRRRENHARGGERPNDRCRGDLSWIEICLHCTASIAARSNAGRGLRRWARSRPGAAANAQFTVVAEFIN